MFAFLVSHSVLKLYIDFPTDVNSLIYTFDSFYLNQRNCLQKKISLFKQITNFSTFRIFHGQKMFAENYRVVSIDLVLSTAAVDDFRTIVVPVNLR